MAYSGERLRPEDRRLVQGRPVNTATSTRLRAKAFSTPQESRKGYLNSAE